MVSGQSSGYGYAPYSAGYARYSAGHVTAATDPLNNGLITQLRTMPPSPPSIFQFKQSAPVPAIVIPTTPPTIACVVETGIDVMLASCRNIDAPINAPIIPDM